MMFSFRTWLANWRKQQNRRRTIRPLRPPLTLENLESRLTPAVITVNLASDPVLPPNNGLDLRQAIQLADGSLAWNNLTAAQKALDPQDPAKSASNTIIFKIANAPQTINVLQGVLPAVTKPTIIDGSPQAGFGNQTITIDGGKLDPADIKYIYGLYFDTQSSGSAVYGLTVQDFYDDGIVIKSDDNSIGGSATDAQNTIQNNGVGVHIKGGGKNTLIGNSILNSMHKDPAGGVRGRFGAGVLIEDNGSSNTIGKDVTPNAAGVIAQNTAANVISGNQNVGVAINGGTSNIVIGNFIGLKADGAAPSANGIGVKISGASTTNRIGGFRAGERNTISANTFGGILVQGKGATNNTIEGNNIGTKNDGSDGKVGNGLDAIAFTADKTGDPSANNVKVNRIKYNAGGAVKKEGSDKQNFVYDPNSIAFNGAGIDDGANDGPVLNSAAVSANSISIQGTYSGTPNTSFLLEFFGNSVEGPSGYGEGEYFLGDSNVTTDSNGNASFQVTFDSIYGSYVSATAAPRRPTPLPAVSQQPSPTMPQSPANRKMRPSAAKFGTMLMPTVCWTTMNQGWRTSA